MTSAARVVVRRARQGDLDAVVGMRLALVRESRRDPAHRRLRRDYAARAPALFAAQFHDARCLTLVACVGAKCVGMLRCALSTANPLRRPSRHAYIMSVYVAGEHRRRGVLRALLRRADVWCARQGVAELRLHCAVDNAAGNAAWQALGFDPAEVLYVRRVRSRVRR